MARPSARTLVWVGFVVVHVWLAFVGVVLLPGESFHDVDLYRWWMYQGLTDGAWPVIGGSWVYPVGAIVPMVFPAIISTTSTTAYAIGWCLLITALDAAAVAALLRRGRPGALGAGWWLVFLAALGPVAMGRLDAVAAPIMVLALLAAVRRPRVAAALMMVGAWIKVAPGALLLPLVVVARRPIRDVVVPAAAVCAAVVAAVAAAGGIGNIATFLGDQTTRGLQVESVAATPLMLGYALGQPGVSVRLNQTLSTWEIVGPDTTGTSQVLNVALALGVGAACALIWWAGRRGRTGLALLPGSLLLLTLLIVLDKVGSPQYMSWLAAPVAVVLSTQVSRPRRWVPAAAGMLLVAAGLTQVVFPWGYPRLLLGDLGIGTALALRNLLLVALVVVAVVGLIQVGHADAPDDDDALDDVQPDAVRPDFVQPDAVEVTASA